MKARNGQVAVYLALVLVAVCVLAVMNVGVFLSVRAKNHAMNAGDAAALAVAQYQGELLNRIGNINLAHLKAVCDRSQAKGLTPEERQARLDNARNACLQLMDEQRRICFLEPLGGIRIANEWAQRNGITIPDKEAEDILREHVGDILNGYALDPEQYHEPWEGAWREYAMRLEVEIEGGIIAAPDNIDFVDASHDHYLLNAQFYNAIAGRNWCWFHFNAPGLLENYSGFRSWPQLPLVDEETLRIRCCNSEIFSLHLKSCLGSAIGLLSREMVKNLTGLSDQDLDDSVLVNDTDQVWYFYDWGPSDENYDYRVWRPWYEIDPEANEYNEGRGFPVVGKVKPEYNVRGCSANCRVRIPIPNIVSEGGVRSVSWIGAAKPFGTVENEDGVVDVVTALKGLVLPSFNDVRLVPLDSVGGSDTERPNLDMVRHIRDHLAEYLRSGTTSTGCFYCMQLRQWERQIFREEGILWLKFNAGSCVRSTGPGTARGGTSHGH